MNQPNDAAFAANGDVYVSDGYGNDRVVVFDKNGKFVRAWGKLGTGPGEFSRRIRLLWIPAAAFTLPIETTHAFRYLTHPENSLRNGKTSSRPGIS